MESIVVQAENIVSVEDEWGNRHRFLYSQVDSFILIDLAIGFSIYDSHFLYGSWQQHLSKKKKTLLFSCKMQS